VWAFTTFWKYIKEKEWKLFPKFECKTTVIEGIYLLIHGAKGHIGILRATSVFKASIYIDDDWISVAQIQIFRWRGVYYTDADKVIQGCTPSCLSSSVKWYGSCSYAKSVNFATYICNHTPKNGVCCEELHLWIVITTQSQTVICRPSLLFH